MDIQWSICMYLPSYLLMEWTTLSLLLLWEKQKKKKSYTVIVLPNNTCYVSRQKYVFNFSSPGPQFFQTFIQRDKFRWRTWQNSLNLFSTYHDAKITPTTGTVLKVGQWFQDCPFKDAISLYKLPSLAWCIFLLISAIYSKWYKAVHNLAPTCFFLTISTTCNLCSGCVDNM